MRYNLRSLLAMFAAVAVAFYFLSIAFARRSDFFALLPGAAILAAILGWGLGLVCRLRNRWRSVLTVSFALAAGGACSFFVIQAETTEGRQGITAHPWPDSLELYIAFAIVRSALVGGILGFAVAWLFQFAAGSSESGEEARGATPGGVPKSSWTGVLLVVAIVAAAVSWSPYLSAYMQDLTRRRFLAAIDAGDLELARARLATAKRYHVKANMISGMPLFEQQGRDERARMTALKALKLFDETELPPQRLRVILNEMRMHEPDPEIRAAAANWLAKIEQEPGR